MNSFWAGASGTIAVVSGDSRVGWRIPTIVNGTPRRLMLPPTVSFGLRARSEPSTVTWDPPVPGREQTALGERDGERVEALVRASHGAADEVRRTEPGVGGRIELDLDLRIDCSHAGHATDLVGHRQVDRDRAR
jgi:hypothetical protein